MKQYSVLVLATILLAVAACTPASTQTPLTSAGVNPPPSSLVTPVASPRAITPTVEPTLVPNPLNVTVKLDDKLTSSAVMSSAGGTVSVKAGDGTRFTLSLPKGALLDEQQIALTPATRVEGLPFSGELVGAVQMAPEGLRLYQQASLTIESPKANPAKGYDLVAFAYHQNGEGFYLTPSQAEGNRITIPVWHFSGGGAAQGTPTEIQAQQRRVPANPEDALNQRMAEYLGRQRQQQLLGQPADPELEAKVIAFQREYFVTVIRPQLAVIRQDCEASKSLLPQALGWLRMVQLWGLEDKFQSESQQIYDAWDDAIVICYNKEYDDCVKDRDIKHRAAMLNLLRLAEIGRSSTVLARLDQSKPWKCPRRSYRVDQMNGDAHFVGTICSLEKPFKLDDTVSREGAWVFTFTPASEKGGTVQMAGTIFPDIAQTGAGAYQVSGTDAAPVIQIPGIQVTTVAEKVLTGAAPPIVLKLDPLDGACVE